MSGTRFKPVLSLLWLLVLLTGHVNAESSEDIAIDFDRPPDADSQLTEHLFYGVNMIGSFEFMNDYDLDHDDDDHLMLFEPEINAVLSYLSPRQLLVYGEFQFDGRYFISQGPDNDENDERHLKIDQLYVKESLVSGSLGYTFGRQSFKDSRSWWYDDNLDGLKLSWKIGEGIFSLAYARENAFDNDLILDRDTEKPVDYLIFTAGVYHDKREQSSFILVASDDKRPGRDDTPVFLGYQRVGEIGSNVRYWMTGALLGGQSRDRDLRAYAVDTGLSIRMNTAWRPFVTLGVAYGSGDDDLSDGVDGNFRQTGLQDNESRTFGSASYNYYGEVLDLELGNIQIGTLGIGVKPDSSTSLELLYHEYRQVEAEDELVDTDLEEDPEGDLLDIGRELDLVFAHRTDENTKVTFTLARFEPGEAYSRTDPVTLLKLKFSYQF